MDLEWIGCIRAEDGEKNNGQCEDRIRMGWMQRGSFEEDNFYLNDYRMLGEVLR